MATEIPPWLTRDYDPVGSYIRSYQIGAQIGEAQTRIAEQQRQADMEHAAKQEAMQANILKAQQEMLMEKAYKDAQLSLESARLTEVQQKNQQEAQHAAAVLEETKRRNLAAGLQAAASLKEREKYHEGMVGKQGALNEAKRADQEKFASLVKQYLAQGMSRLEAVQRAQVEVPGIGVTASTIPTLAQGERGQEAAERYVNEHKYTAAERRLATIEEKLSSAGAADPQVRSSLIVQQHEARRAVEEAEQALRKKTKTGGQSPYPEGTILKKKDGSRWIVRNGVPVPYTEPVSSATSHEQEPTDEEGE